MRMNSTHAVSAMRFKNHGELCPELKTVSVTIKPLLIDMSLEYQFIVTGLNVRVTRAEYMGEEI